VGDLASLNLTPIFTDADCVDPALISGKIDQKPAKPDTFSKFMSIQKGGEESKHG
jgi:hypothetical protein